MLLQICFLLRRLEGFVGQVLRHLVEIRRQKNEVFGDELGELFLELLRAPRG